MEEETGIYSRELFDPTDVNDFRNRRVLIDLQEKTPSISIYIAKEDAYIASLTGIIKSNRTKFLLIVPNKRVMKVSKLFCTEVFYCCCLQGFENFLKMRCVVVSPLQNIYKILFPHAYKYFLYAFKHSNLINKPQLTFIY